MGGGVCFCQASTGHCAAFHLIKTITSKAAKNYIKLPLRTTPTPPLHLHPHSLCRFPTLLVHASLSHKRVHLHTKNSGVAVLKGAVQSPPRVTRIDVHLQRHYCLNSYNYTYPDVHLHRSYWAKKNPKTANCCSLMLYVSDYLLPYPLSV